MSQDNVELQHRAVDAFNRRDLDAYLALQDSAVEFTPFERAVEGLGPYRGHDGIRKWWVNSFETFPDLALEVHDVRRHGDKTLVCGRLYGTGAGSGAPFEQTAWLAAEWREKRVVWWYAFQNEADALEAVGLAG